MMKKILIVDNDRILLKLMTRLLENEGHHVVTAEDGIKALDILRDYIPDIIFIDLVMPNIDGMMLCKIIQSNDKIKDAKIVILSATAAEEMVDVTQLGVHAYIAKGPFNETRKHILEVISQADPEQNLSNEILGIKNLYPRGITEELLIAKKHFEAILEKMSEGVAEINSDGRIIYANPSMFHLVDLPRHELLGAYFVDLFTGVDQRRIVGFLETKRGDAISLTEDSPVRMNGHLVTLDFLPFKEYGFTGIIINDVTERKQITEELKLAKEAAEKANSAKSQFLATMSHELRTPLNHILGFAELLVDKKLGDLNETQHEYLNDILESGMHLLSLVNDILDLAKVEAGKMDLDLVEMDVKAHLENSAVIVQENTSKKGIQFKLDLSTAPEKIKADERKFKQIIYNLLSNAIKFTPEGGEVCLTAKTVNRIVRPGQRQADSKDFRIIVDTIEGEEDNACRHDKCVEITVSDTGVGIAPEEKKRIFRPFEQIEDSLSNRPRGTGLGLSLTKMLVELHGGKIWVESEGKGKGSCFNFIIPV